MSDTVDTAAGANDAELDLERTLRPGLDILANEIVIALRKRVRFPRNPEVYRAGLVTCDPSVALLDYMITQVERNHAALGRYTYASQESFSDQSAVAPIIARRAPPSAVRPMRPGAGARVMEFYRGWVEEACVAGSDADTFGETVTADVDALLCILERVSLGKLVAESKYTAMPDAFAATAGKRTAIEALIVHRGREQQVRERATQLAARYAIDPELVVPVFDWMIMATVDLEVDYIRMRIGAA